MIDLGQNASEQGAVIGCTIQISGDGALTVQRSAECTPADVRELCWAMARGEVEVIDLTP